LLLYLLVTCKAKPAPIKHIWFLPSQKEAIATKPKELDFQPSQNQRRRIKG